MVTLDILFLDKCSSKWLDIFSFGIIETFLGTKLGKLYKNLLLQSILMFLVVRLRQQSHLYGQAAVI